MVHVGWHDEDPPAALMDPQHVCPVQSAAPRHESAMPVHDAVAVHELTPASVGPGGTQQTMPVPQFVPMHSPGGGPASGMKPPLLLPLLPVPPLLLLLPVPPLLLPLLLPPLPPSPGALELELHATAAPRQPIPITMYKIRVFMKASLELPARNVVCSRCARSSHGSRELRISLT
jgi:hypothetical protein